MDIVFDNVFRWHCLLMHCLLRGPAPRSMGENSATYDRYVHNTHSIAIYTYIDNVTQTYLSTLLLLFLCVFSKGKFTISAGNTVMPVYTAELYPTAIRNAGVGACNVAAGVALIIVPYLSLLVSIITNIKSDFDQFQSITHS